MVAATLCIGLADGLSYHIFLCRSQLMFSSFMLFPESKQRLFTLRQLLKVKSVFGFFAFFVAD